MSHRWFLILLTAAVVRAWGESPAISKVEPPDWVAPSEATTIRLMLTGRDLEDVALSGDSFVFARASSSVTRHYAWVDAKIPAGARPGDYTIRVTGRGGSTSFVFRLTAPLNARENFQGYSSDDLIYLIMPDRFANGDPSNDDPAVSKGIFDRKNRRYYHGGDFAGIRQKLPYLKDLGVTAIWLTPIYDNANRIGPKDEWQGEKMSSYHGYGAVDFYGVEEHFGTLEEYCALVREAHRAGIKVIQDQVANHAGALHPWLADPPDGAWFHGTPERHPEETWQVWSLADPHASASMKRGVLDGWFSSALPDLNQDNPEVRKYLIQNTVWWMGRTGVDAIREDTAPYVPRSFWHDWSAAIHANYPRARIVGEAWDEDPAIAAFFQGGHTGYDGVDTGIDGVFDFPLCAAIRKVFGGHEPASLLGRIFGQDGYYANPAQLVTFVGLHDQSRFLHEAKDGDAALELALTFLFTVRGTPMVYYGDEIGMTGGDDPENRRDFPGGWREDGHNAFEAQGRTPMENRIHDLVRRLSALRKNTEALRRGSTESVVSSATTYAFVRASGTSKVLVIVHTGAAAEAVPVPLRDAGFAENAVLADALGGHPALTVHGGAVAVQAAPRSVAVYRLVN